MLLFTFVVVVAIGELTCCIVFAGSAHLIRLFKRCRSGAVVVVWKVCMTMYVCMRVMYLLYPNVYHVYCICACICVSLARCRHFVNRIRTSIVGRHRREVADGLQILHTGAARTEHACYCDASCIVYRVFARVLLPCFDKHLYILLNGTAEC